ncbi:MAG: hypothetical protein AB7V32_09710 [Candidatus Berkiella sp.]
MNNMINNLFKLVKSGYHCKRSIKKNLKGDKNAQTYVLAKYYDALVKDLEESDELTTAQIETILKQINTHRTEHQEKEEVQQFLSNILAFFETVQPFVKEKLA